MAAAPEEPGLGESPEFLPGIPADASDGATVIGGPTPRPPQEHRLDDPEDPMDFENPQQDGDAAERRSTAGSRHSAVRHMSQAEQIRRAAAERNAAIEAELAALAAGHGRSLKRRTSGGAEPREEQTTPPP